MNKLSIPEQYSIFQQDLSVRPPAINLMCIVRSLSEAQNMLQVFLETDEMIKSGKHSYFYVCTSIEGE